MNTKNKLIEFAAGIMVLIFAGFFSFYIYSLSGIGNSSAVKNSNYYYGVFKDVSGVSVSSDVKIGGIVVGKVESLSINDSLNAVVKVSIRKDICVPEDSSLEVATSGVLGARFLVIQPGSDDECLNSDAYFENVKSALSIESLVSKFIAAKKS